MDFSFFHCSNVEKLHLSTPIKTKASKIMFSCRKAKSMKIISGHTKILLCYYSNKKSRIWETKHLSTDADSSTDAIGRWTKNTQKPDFFEKRNKITKNTKTQKRLEI